MADGSSREPAPAAGQLTGQGKQAVEPGLRCRRAWVRAAVALVAVIVAGLAVVAGTAHLNVVLLEIAAGTAVAEPVARMTRGVRPSGGRGDQPAAVTDGRPG